jgi:hypothetical protein
MPCKDRVEVFHLVYSDAKGVLSHYRTAKILLGMVYKALNTPKAEY